MNEIDYSQLNKGDRKSLARVRPELRPAMFKVLQMRRIITMLGDDEPSDRALNSLQDIMGELGEVIHA
jgi:hypothetical protein